MENKTKAMTYVGFAIRAGKCKIGTGAVETLKKAELIIVCSSTGENTLKEAQKLAKKLNCKIIKTVNNTLEEMTFKKNAKVMAVTDKSLAKAIYDQKDIEFVEVGEIING